MGAPQIAGTGTVRPPVAVQERVIRRAPARARRHHHTGTGQPPRHRPKRRQSSGPIRPLATMCPRCLLRRRSAVHDAARIRVAVWSTGTGSGCERLDCRMVAGITSTRPAGWRSTCRETSAQADRTGCGGDIWPGDIVEPPRRASDVAGPHGRRGGRRRGGGASTLDTGLQRAHRMTQLWRAHLRN